MVLVVMTERGKCWFQKSPKFSHKFYHKHQTVINFIVCFMTSPSSLSRKFWINDTLSISYAPELASAVGSLFHTNFDKSPKFIQKFTIVVRRYQMCSSSEIFSEFVLSSVSFSPLDFVFRNFIYIPNMA